VYVVDSETSYCDVVSECLKGAGYHVETFMKGEDVLEQVKLHPPHIIVLGTYLLGMTGLQLVKRVRELSPDIQLIVMANYAEGEIASEALAHGAADRVYKPIQNIADVVTAVDRVAERRFLEFSNEALYNGMTAAKTAQRRLRRRFVHERAVLDLAQRLSEKIKPCRDGSEALSVLTKALADELKTRVLFFRYLPMQEDFICVQSADENLKGVHLNVTAASLASDPEGVRDVLAVMLGQAQFDYRILKTGGEILGLLVLGKTLNDVVLRRSVSQAVSVFELHHELFELRKALHENLIRDEVTGLWIKAEFQRRAEEEISRARRLKMPVSMLVVGLDEAQELKASLGEKGFRAVLAKIASALARTSRVTDVLGRLAEGEIGVLLPHTDKLGAAIKAEKFRRLIERADFSPEAGVEAKIRVSVGVSEYPSICLDAETLWNAADSAYFQVKRLGNKVCLAATPKDFEPDFIPKTV
jgi:diguanylate cyclase (GGDEF)-like protein